MMMTVRKIVLCSLMMAVMCVILPVSALGAVSLSAFPDPVFREYMTRFDKGWTVYDSDGNPTYGVGANDGILADVEIAQISSLWLGGWQVTSLKGIEYLSALSTIHCNGAHLTELDVSNNRALSYLACSNNNITSLTIGSLPALQKIECDGNQITELDISGCTALEMVYCSENQITNLNAAGCISLWSINCWDNKITELNLSGCSALKELHCHTNQLEYLNVADCTALETFNCWNNKITELDLSCNTALIFDSRYGSNGHLWQKIEGLKVKKTSDGYEVNMKLYVFRPENIEYITDPDDQLVSYSKGNGIAVFSGPIVSLNYGYDTGLTFSGDKVLMPVEITDDISIAALERSGFEDDTIIRSMTDDSYFDRYETRLTEAALQNYSYADYGKLGLAADGNSRLILRVQTRKSGTVSFSVEDNIGAKLESLSRSELSDSDQLATTEMDTDIHQVSAVLIAPERFPEEKTFPSDTFKVTVKFTDEDGETTEDDLELKIEAAPVLLIPGIFDNAAHTFGSTKNSGVWRGLLNAGFSRECIDVWDYDRSKSSEELAGRDYNNDLFRVLTEMFNRYAEKGIACTKADIVAHGFGGLLARRYLHEDGKDSQDGNNWSVRSYKQGMVRRLITVATPHYGTPWADDLDKKRFITMMYNGILNTPFFDEHPIATSVMDKVFLIRMSNLMINTCFPSPQLLRNAYIFNGNAWDEMRTTTYRNYGFPAGVPMFAIYGNIVADGTFKDAWNLLTKIIDVTTGVDVDIYDIPSMLLSKIEDKLTQSMKDSKVLMLFSFLRDTPAYMRIFTDIRAEHLFASEPNDLIVSASSASAAVNSFGYVNNGWEVIDPNPFDQKNGRYSHWSICQQIDVGTKIASLLKGERSKFTVFDSEMYEHPQAAKTYASNAASSAEDIDTEEISLIETLKLKVEPPILSGTDNAQTVKITVTADESVQNDVYCTFGNEDDCRFFKMPVSDSSRTKFEAAFNAAELFNGMDTGTIEILCLSCISEDNDILGMYTSNTVNVASLDDLNAASIVRLDISELSALTLAAGTQIPAVLYAVADDGKYYDVSSPLAGTVWTSSNPEIAYVDESGVIHALSSGTITLTAEYSGLTASITVTVPQPERYTIFTESNFPDDNFRNFILNNCDYDSSGQISDEEIIGTNTLNLSGQGISSLKGIEYFTSLEYLDCRNNNITVIDITGLPNLDPEKFFYDDSVTINDGLPKPAFKSANLILSGQIGVNFFLDLPAISGVDYYNGNSCYMGFDINGDSASNNPQPTDGSLKLGELFGYRCYVNSVQMADPITADFHYGDGKTVSYVYTVKRYLDNKIKDTSNAPMQKLAAAIKDYGHYAQLYLSRVNNWKLGEKHIAVEAANEYTASDIESVRQIANQYAPVRDDYAGTGIQGVSYSLELAAETTINLTFTMDSGYSGNVFASLNGGRENMAVRQTDGTYLVQIAGISAHRLGDTQTVKFTAAKDFTIKVSALTFVYTSMRNSSAEEDRQKLAAALYKYYTSAIEFKNAN